MWELNTWYCERKKSTVVNAVWSLSSYMTGDQLGHCGLQIFLKAHHFQRLSSKQPMPNYAPGHMIKESDLFPLTCTVAVL